MSSDRNSSDKQRKNRERQIANLVPFQPGQSGNPRGRPKGWTLTQILREKLNDHTFCGQPLPDGMTVADLLITAALKHAINGDASLIREAFNRMDGKVTEPEAGGDPEVADVLAEAAAIRRARKSEAIDEPT